MTAWRLAIIAAHNRSRGHSTKIAYQDLYSAVWEVYYVAAKRDHSDSIRDYIAGRIAEWMLNKVSTALRQTANSSQIFRFK